MSEDGARSRHWRALARLHGQAIRLQRGADWMIWCRTSGMRCRIYIEGRGEAEAFPLPARLPPL